jgi:ribosomal RNA-processing protein 36
MDYICLRCTNGCISADKRSLLTRARYDAIAAGGGKGAVKKAIEKKQKKIAGKEKRSRPFGRPKKSYAHRIRSDPGEDGRGT